MKLYFFISNRIQVLIESRNEKKKINYLLFIYFTNKNCEEKITLKNSVVFLICCIRKPRIL